MPARSPILLRPKGRTLIRPYLHGAKDVNSGFYRFLHSPTFQIAIENEEAEEFSAEGGVDSLIDSQITSTSITGSMTTKDITLLGLKWFLQASEATRSQESATAATMVLPTVQKDRYYKLGVTSSLPTGVRGITNVSIVYGGDPNAEPDPIAPTSATVNTDYTILADQGLIYITPNSAISGPATITYNAPAGSYIDLQAAATTPIYTEIVIYADNQSGENRPYYAPRVVMSPTGELAAKRLGAEPVEITFNLKFLLSDSESPLYVSDVFVPTL